MAVLVLKGANFSAKNIGQITINRELSELTASVMAMYAGSSSLTTKKKFALDDFLNGLDSSGLLTKIKVLSIPALASTIQEAFKDIKGLALVPAAGYIEGWKLSGGGVMFDSVNAILDSGTNKYTNLGAILLASPLSLSAGLHFSAFKLTPSNGQSQNQAKLIGCFDSNGYPSLGANGSTIGASPHNVTINTTDANLLRAKGHYILNHVRGSVPALTLAGATDVFFKGGKLGTKTGSGLANVTSPLQNTLTSSTQNTSSLRILSNGTNNNDYINKLDAIGMWTIGEPFSDTEAVAFNTLTEQFFTGFFA